MENDSEEKPKFKFERQLAKLQAKEPTAYFTVSRNGVPLQVHKSVLLYRKRRRIEDTHKRFRDTIFRVVLENFKFDYDKAKEWLTTPIKRYFGYTPESMLKRRHYSGLIKHMNLVFSIKCPQVRKRTF